MIQTYFDTEEGAKREVSRGRAWAAITFASNYSESLVQRTEDGQGAEEWTIEASDVNVQLDMSSKFE